MILRVTSNQQNQRGESLPPFSIKTKGALQIKEGRQIYFSSSAPGRTWYEADAGLNNKMSRSNQPGTRLLYSDDGLLYITSDHYNTASSIGTWK
nr:ribonuclease domain-containing protein [Pseudomonas glycinae]